MEEMIGKDDILSFDFYKKGKPFFGSFKGMRYRIVKEKAEEEGDPDRFRIDTWPEPLGFDATDDDRITTQKMPFTLDGYNEVLKYLNDIWDYYKM